MSQALTPISAPNVSNHLLDCVLNKLRLKNDAALARTLKVAPPVISKIRHRTLPVGSTMIINIHEVTDMPIADIKALIVLDNPVEEFA